MIVQPDKNLQTNTFYVLAWSYTERILIHMHEWMIAGDSTSNITHTTMVLYFVV